MKGRFAWGYATHKDRITKPMIREKITDPWREVSWDEALTYAATQFRKLQDKYGRDSIGGITSSRCTNEETYLVQKLVRAAFGNNNVDTCARVCHSPTGYGLKTTLGESAGTQTFASVGADVIVVMGANPTDGHPVFGSRLKRRVREGAKLIVIDPRRIDVVDGPHVKATHHLQLRPGTNVAIVNALAHVIVTEGRRRRICRRALRHARIRAMARVRLASRQLARGERRRDGRAGRAGTRSRAPLCDGRQCRDLLRRASPNTHRPTTVMGIANLAMATGNIGREGVGVNRCAARTTCRAVRHGVPARTARLPAHRRRSRAHAVRSGVVGEAATGTGAAHPEHVRRGARRQLQGALLPGEDIVQSDPNTQHVAAALSAMECIVVQDIFLNETAKYAHVLLPGSSFLEKDGTFTNAERRISRVRR